MKVKPILILAAAALAFAGLVTLGFYFYQSWTERNARERHNAATREAAMRELTKDVVRLNSDNLKRMEGGTLTAADGINAASRTAEMMEEASKIAVGEEAMMLRGMSAALRELRTLAEPYVKASEEIMRESPMQPEWIKEKSDLDRLIPRIELFEKESVRMRTVREDFGKLMRSALERAGASANRIDALAGPAIIKFNAGAADLRILCDTDAEYVKILRETTALLKREWGHWRAKDELIEFDDQDASEQYSAIYNRLNKTIQKQAEAQKRFAERLK